MSGPHGQSLDVDWADYPRLLEIKNRYDPDNVFSVHHGVGTD